MVLFPTTILSKRFFVFNILQQHKDLLQLLINANKGVQDDDSSTKKSIEELKSRGREPFIRQYVIVLSFRLL